MSHGTLVWGPISGPRQIDCSTEGTAPLSARGDSVLAGLQRCPLDGGPPSRLLPVDTDATVSNVDGIGLAKDGEQAWLITDAGALALELDGSDLVELVAVRRDRQYAALRLGPASSLGSTSIGVFDLRDGRRVTAFEIPHGTGDMVLDGSWQGPLLLLLGRSTLWIVLDAATAPTVHTVTAEAGVRAAQDATRDTVLLGDVGSRMLLDGATATATHVLGRSAYARAPRAIAPSADGYVVLEWDGVSWLRGDRLSMRTVHGIACAIDVLESTGTAACCDRGADGDDWLVVYAREAAIALEVPLPSSTCTSRVSLGVSGTRVAVASERRLVVTDAMDPNASVHVVEVRGSIAAEFVHRVSSAAGSRRHAH